MSPQVGVLALQGDFAEHVAVLDRLKVSAAQVRARQDLVEVDALIIPGGESTTILKLIDRCDLRDLITKRIREGMPVLGTCAGAIVMARECSDGEPPLGVLDISVTRNAYGRQRESFEADIEVDALGDRPVRAVFIRAPHFHQIGSGIEVLGSWADRPVILRQDRILATAFHPELTDEDRLHAYFLESVCKGV